MKTPKTLFSTLLNAGRAPESVPTEELTQLRVTTAIIFCLFVVGFSIGIAHLYIGIPTISYALFGSVGIGLVCYGFMFKYDCVNLCAHIMILLVLAVITVANIEYGGYYSPNFAWFYAVILISGLAISVHAMWVYTILVAIIFLVIHKFEAMNLLPFADHLIQNEELAQGLNRFGFLFVISILITAFQSMHKHYEKAMKEARENEAAANRSKSEFLAKVSHDIRTPMTGIIGMSDVLRKTELNEKQHYYVNVIQESADMLMSFVNDILDHEHLVSRKLVLKPEAFNLRKTIENLATLMSTHAHKKGLEFSYYLPPELPVELVGDARRIKQILTNIINNAIKFTHIGGIHVRVHYQKQDSNTLAVTFDIIDTGIGIPEQHQNDIFDAFTQASTIEPGEVAGAGLGLSITKSLVELMQGNIHIDSTEGKGTTFSVTLPMEVSLNSPEDPLALHAQNAKALCIDLNENDKYFIQSILQNWDLHVATTDYWPIGLSMLEDAQKSNEPYDFLIFDHVKMKKDAKNDLICKLKKHKTHCIILHKPGEEVSINYCDHCQAHLLEKPLHQSSLFNILVKALGKNTTSKAKEHRETEQQRNAIGTLKAKILVAEDSHVNRNLLAALLHNLGVDPTFVKNGTEALEEMQRNTYDLILMDCHMPILDGFEATEQIRALSDNKLKNIPVIALTADALEGDRQKCLRYGMNDYLSKPYTEHDLARILEKWLKGVK